MRVKDMTLLNTIKCSAITLTKIDVSVIEQFLRKELKLASTVLFQNVVTVTIQNFHTLKRLQWATNYKSGYEQAFLLYLST